MNKQTLTNQGFTSETEIWCSAGFYKTIQELLDKGESFITDSLMEDDVAFITNVAHITPRVDKVVELIEVTYGGKVSLGVEQAITVRCTPDQKFLTCYENSGKMYYSNDTLLWKEASKLKPGIRLVAEDANIEVKEVKKVTVPETEVFSVTTTKDSSFSIRLGVIVRGE